MTIFRTTNYHDDAGRVVEHDQVHDQLLDPGTFHCQVTLQIQGPQGQMPLAIRVPLLGAEGIEHAFANLEQLVKANIDAPARAAVKKLQDDARANMLRAGVGMMPPLKADRN